ncbi:K02A2.6-like [Cordylochernes scorpioides]|uniref:K02A2.6-like n=1 Tax=Cordylochernes scorpioides TaxID=51811 RepID=A0ABY6L0F8_9ARAC|nr:K02A2.6-like [Cordylochernes scorpioides]
MRNFTTACGIVAYMWSYYLVFIIYNPNCALSLSDLLWNNAKFQFGAEQQNAFFTLKERLSQKPVLHIFKQGWLLELHTDASSHGLGAVLLQKPKIHYISKKKNVTPARNMLQLQTGSFGSS